MPLKHVLRHAVLIAMMAGLPGCAALSPPGPVGNRAVPEPTRTVDLDRYLGRWYEIYRYEAPFQKDCEAVFADYSRTGSAQAGETQARVALQVVNSCRKGSVDGPLKTATGRIRIADPVTNAKLKVSFFGPFYGDYWVLDRGPEYDWSIVGEPSGRYLWVLSRDPKPAPSMRAMLRQRVEQLGYDWSLVRETRQP